jgi:hypothetical protein
VAIGGSCHAGARDRSIGEGAGRLRVLVLLVETHDRHGSRDGSRF